MLEKLPEVIGHVLREQRAGLDKLVFHRVDLRGGSGSLSVRSLAFADHAPIPARYTADGDGVSPPLQWAGVPAAAGSLVLVVEDADAPLPQPLVHAIVVGLPAEEGALAEGDFSRGSDPALHAGRNSFLGARWLPPDPPPGHGTHRYAFQLFALEAGAAFSSTPGRDEVVDMICTYAVASGLLIGTYERPDGLQKVGAPQHTETAAGIELGVPGLPGASVGTGI